MGSPTEEANVQSFADKDLVLWSEEWFKERVRLMHSWVLALLCYPERAVRESWARRPLINGAGVAMQGANRSFA